MRPLKCPPGRQNPVTSHQPQFRRWMPERGSCPPLLQSPAVAPRCSRVLPSCPEQRGARSSDSRLMPSAHPCPSVQVKRLLHLARHLHLLRTARLRATETLLRFCQRATRSCREEIVPKISCKRKTVPPSQPPRQSLDTNHDCLGHNMYTTKGRESKAVNKNMQKQSSS